MAELPGQEFIPGAALQRRQFGRGAWAGSVAPASTMRADERFADPAPFMPPRGFRVTPVNPTSYSAGNKIRLGVVGIMLEWWRFRRPMRGDIFVANSDQFHRVVARRMSRVRRLDRVVPNRRVTYEAQSYGSSEARTATGLPNFSRRRR